ncbi:MAG: hypothetical protein HRU19_26975 [Pseudobacteriovorax sp.]|nr:hypothetical protein [Pseudobacteriovorax sp.]
MLHHQREKKSTTVGNNLKRKFLSLLDDSDALFAKFDFSYRLNSIEAMNQFEQLPRFQKKEIIAQLIHYNESLKNTPFLKGQTPSEQQMLWQALGEFELRTPENIYAAVSDESQIEIYDLQNIQIWRNFNVLKICSYTLADILCFTWEERYHREDAYSSMILERVGEALQGKYSDISTVPYHHVQEKFSCAKYLLGVKHRSFFPLFTPRGDVNAFCVVSEVDVLSSHA